MILVLLILCGAFVASAQGVDDQGKPNDPVVNERANACFEGGSQEGRCVTDAEWTCGWYLIRWEADPGYKRPSFCGPVGADGDGGTDPGEEPLVCENLLGSSALYPDPFPMERCANSEWGYDDWFEDGSHDYLYYFGKFGVCPASPATHTLYAGPSSTALTIWEFPPYNVTASQLCVYELITLT